MVRVVPVVVKNGMQFFCYQDIYLTSEVLACLAGVTGV
jgi:hypothetical protein